MTTDVKLGMVVGLGVVVAVAVTYFPKAGQLSGTAGTVPAVTAAAQPGPAAQLQPAAAAPGASARLGGR
jgi:hypothetical protein